MPLSLAVLVFAWTLSSNVRCGLKLLKQDGASLSDCTTLDLGGAMLGNAGLVNLTAALARDGGAPGLRTIKLNNNELSDAAAIGAFVGAVAVHAAALDLRHNELGDDATVALARGIQAGSTITQLDLAGNGIGSRGAVALGLALRRVARPDADFTLNLWQNSLSDQGVKLFVKAALAPPRVALPLRALYLSHNSIGDEGALWTSLLISQSSLTYLDLQQNLIGDEGARSIAGALSESPAPTLTHLFIGFNKITTHGRATLGAALRENTIIEQIDGGWRADVADNHRTPEAPMKWKSNVGYVSKAMANQHDRRGASQRIHADEINQRSGRTARVAVIPAALHLDASALRHDTLPRLENSSGADASTAPRIRLSPQLWGRRVLEWSNSASPFSLHLPQLSATAGIPELTIFAVASVERRRGAPRYTRPGVDAIEVLRRLALVECGATEQRGGLFVAPFVGGVASQLGLLEGAASPNRFDYDDEGIQDFAPRFSIIVVQKKGRREDMYINGTLVFSEVLARSERIYGASERCRVGPKPSTQNNATSLLAELRVFTGAFTADVRRQVEQQLYQKWFAAPVWDTHTQRLESDKAGGVRRSASSANCEDGHVAASSAAFQARILLAQCARPDQLLDDANRSDTNCVERVAAWSKAFAHMHDRVAFGVTAWLSRELWPSCVALCVLTAIARLILGARAHCSPLHHAHAPQSCARRWKLWCRAEVHVGDLNALPRTFRALAEATGHPVAALRLLSREGRKGLVLRPSAFARRRTLAARVGLCSVACVAALRALRIATSLRITAEFAVELQRRVAALATVALPAGDCSFAQDVALRHWSAERIHLGAALELPLPPTGLILWKVGIAPQTPLLMWTTAVAGGLLTSWCVAWCEFLR